MKEFAPGVMPKACPHAVTPWWECPTCHLPGNHTTSAHFAHGQQWTPRKEQLRAEMARKPFGD